jgi:peptidyl-prolyl cis-trans isomerase D
MKSEESLDPPRSAILRAMPFRRKQGPCANLGKRQLAATFREIEMGRIGIWIRNLAILAVLATFAFIFGQPRGVHEGSGTGAVAIVNGEPIPRDVFEFFREQNEAAFKQYAEQGVDPEKLRNLIDEQTRASLVRRYVVAQEAESLGLAVSDESLKADFQSTPGFQRDGVFDREIAERYISRTGLGPREYAAQHRRDLLMRNFSRFVASPVRVSDADVRDEILRADTKISLRYATASKAALRGHVSVTPEEAKALVEKEPDRVRGAYQLRIAEFSKEEQVHARHILFTGDDAEAHALAARGRIEGGEKFADVAKELSVDAATRADGGDLGSFPRGRMMAPFDEVAFALEPGKLSGPVKTDRGVHLILVESHQPASQTPYEQVAEAIAADLLRDDKASEAARSAANALLGKLAAGEPFVQAADAVKLPVSISVPFGIGDASIPGLAGVPDLKEAAFALTMAKPNASRVFSDANNLYVVALQSREEPDEAKIALETATTRDRLLQRERGLTASLWFSERLKELEASGKVKQMALQSGRSKP